MISPGLYDTIVSTTKVEIRNFLRENFLVKM